MVLPSLYDSLEIGEEYMPHALPWSQVRSAYYRPWIESVKPAIPELQKRSQIRMSGNPSFTTFLARRDHIRQRMENPEVSLSLSNRVSEIVSEKEMDDLQDEEFAVNKTDKADKDDPILDEALSITADLVYLKGRKPSVQITKTASN